MQSLRNRIIGAIGLVLLIVLAVCVFAGKKANSPTSPASSSSRVIQVVAAENFWGSLVSQLGGTHVHVLSIVSDPNADPHEYESNATDARAVSDADYVIENGAGYDSWTDKLISAGGNPNRKVFNVAQLVGVPDGGNPHLWYNPAYVNQAIAQMETDLAALDPADTAYFQSQYATLEQSLIQYQNRILSIQKQFGGTKVAATEDIFVYLGNAAGLDIVSPPEFMEAVAEGNDPSAQSVIAFQDELKNDGVRVLVYNQQTVTPLTESIKKLAADQGIPVIGVTETIQPPDTSFQDWMNAELITLQNALNSNTLGQ